MAYIGQILGQDSIFWTTLGVCSALLVAFTQLIDTRPRAVAIAPEETRDATVRLAPGHLNPVAHSSESQGFPWLAVVALIGGGGLYWLYTQTAGEVDDNRSEIASLPSACVAVDGELADHFKIALPGKSTDKLSLGTPNRCDWKQPDESGSQSYRVRYDPHKILPLGTEDTVSEGVKAFTFRQYENGEEICDVSWSTSFGFTQAPVYFKLEGEKVAQDSCAIAMEWAKAIYPRLPH
ncbi:hypothetical protein [Actinokineospora cianjurensis]|uniref:hypothetical protein n=1 Tax=Actinokineospora cianjurensis TaxID=585224 RepID=UPI0011C36625|nr:hypothetical protein [Actinokineospora cianjurensis]